MASGVAAWGGAQGCCSGRHADDVVAVWASSQTSTRIIRCDAPCAVFHLACSCLHILPPPPSPRTSTPWPRTTGGGVVSWFGRVLSAWMTMMSSVVNVRSVGDGDEGMVRLSVLERAAVRSVVAAVIMRCEMEVEGERLTARLRARRRKVMQVPACEGFDSVAVCDAVFEVCCLGCGGLPRATPRWWMKRRTGGTWEDLRPADDATEEYFCDKLWITPRVFREIVENLSPILQRRVTFYREPLQPNHIVAYALYRWAFGETYESSSCSFGIGRASG
ncbi:hypothetical protein CBR_g40685 [Chara braunii]|uniref:Uncharacterized protein n=1 Tax=Chara braunii TaxID=69332 RepID=A0A388LUF5_CHABU|nr:hypothetical protein CBR_g40685 [Chara braunii]|eukprot:GBG85873.1 hypothetical protein CBR_g40685 [Chara braunii]